MQFDKSDGMAEVRARVQELQVSEERSAQSPARVGSAYKEQRKPLPSPFKPGSSQRLRHKDSQESSFHATASATGGMPKKLQKMRRTCRSRMEGVRKQMDQKSKEIREW